MGDDQFLSAKLIAIGFYRWARDLDWPGVYEIPLGDGAQFLVKHRNRAVLASLFHLALDHLIAPLPDIHTRGDTAFEGDVLPLETARDLLHEFAALFSDDLVFDDLVLRADPTAFGKVTLNHSLDVDRIVKTDKRILVICHPIFSCFCSHLPLSLKPTGLACTRVYLFK